MAARAWRHCVDAQFGDKDVNKFVQPVHKRGYALLPAPKIEPPSCLACGKYKPSKVCGRCKVAPFCDEICQRRIWPDHKLKCEPPDSVLARIHEDPQDPDEKADEASAAAEAADLARSMAAFFARGGPKARGAAATGSGGAAADAEAKRPEWLRCRAGEGEASDGAAGEARLGAGGERIGSPTVDAESKRPEWLRRQAGTAGEAAATAGKACRGADAEGSAVDAEASRPDREGWAGEVMGASGQAQAAASTGAGPPCGSDAAACPPEDMIAGTGTGPAADRASTSRGLPGGGRAWRCSTPQAEPRSPAEQPSGGASASDCRGGLFRLHTGASMPRIALGTGGYGGLFGKEGRAAIFAALKLGYRAIDTSEMNRNLMDVAWAWLKSGVPRDKIFFIAKIAPWHYGYEQTLKAFARQLHELRLEYVDLLLLQWPWVWDPGQKEWASEQWEKSSNWSATQKKGSWKALEELHGRGKARAIGVSNFTIDQMEGLLRWSDIKPHVVQAESNPHWPNAALRQWCQEEDIVFQGYAPLGGQATDYNKGRRAMEFDIIKEIAEVNRVTPAQVCLQWNLCRNDATVVKSKTPRYLRENLGAGERQLRASDLARVDQIAPAMAEYGPCYWGHNDLDLMNPFVDGERMEEELIAGSNLSAQLGIRPKPRKAKQREGWEPQPPPGSAAPAANP